MTAQHFPEPAMRALADEVQVEFTEGTRQRVLVVKGPGAGLPRRVRDGGAGNRARRGLGQRIGGGGRAELAAQRWFVGARRLVLRQCGDLTLIAGERGGAAFRVTLPLASATSTAEVAR